MFALGMGELSMAIARPCRPPIELVILPPIPNPEPKLEELVDNLTTNPVFTIHASSDDYPVRSIRHTTPNRRRFRSGLRA